MELKAIERTDRAINRLNAALSIYRETILPEAQNPERQIRYWIDHARNNSSDQFRCFAITDANAVVGYLQFSYFRDEHIFFFEYLCIRGISPKGLSFNSALKTIEEYISQHYREGFSIVFEVAQKIDSNQKWSRDAKLIGYFKRVGFRVVNFSYRYPVLQNYIGETSYPADLMVRLPDGRKEVTSSELRSILRCIYFKHYLKWDRPFLSAADLSKREQLIDRLYTSQVSQIDGTRRFGTWGDDKRSQIERFAKRSPSIRKLGREIFAPKFPRIVVATSLMLFIYQLLGSVWSLFPFVLAVSAIFCLAEDTTASKKLLTLIFSKFLIGRQQP